LDIDARSGNYLAGNISPVTPNGVENQWALTFGDEDLKTMKKERVVFSSGLEIDKAEDALEKVLLGSGAIAPLRDGTDLRLVKEVKDRKGQFLYNENDMGGYPVYREGMKLEDQDQDGIPDQWEEDNGLNKADAKDALHIDEEGYTWIEHYVSSLLRSASMQR
jgi:hypothetical protein